MNSDQKFFHFVRDWAKDQKCTFVEQGCDGRESTHLIDDMAADDIWGWLLPEGVNEPSDDYFGCIVWKEKNGHLFLEWRKYDFDYLPVEMQRKGEPKYDIRGISKYCKEHGLDLKTGKGVPQQILKRFQDGEY